jgi:saccharopine dehydrogenase-like NADP-dependent oxidoreductase
MKHALIAGMGLQGVAIAHGMHTLGFKTIGIDKNTANLDVAHKTLNSLNSETELMEADATSPDFNSIHPDIVISALPFHLNFALAEHCINRGVRYCDLGGNTETSDKIAALAMNKASVPVMPDLGLAPGIAGIIAEIGVSRLGGADRVKIRVGGLPVNPKGTLNYGLTFSAQGLYNEYRENCHIIRNAAKIEVEPLTEIEKLYFDGVGDLEAFHTSGGIATTADSMLEKGVKDCDYKTIRFPGHCDLIRFLLFEFGLSKTEFEQGMIRSCGFITDDQILIAIDVTRGDKTWPLRSRSLHDKHFTAMQKTTGYGAVAVASIMGLGMMDHVKAARYQDVPHAQFIDNMKILLPEISIG